MEHCENCKINGRYDFSLECCRVRHYANLPERMQASYDMWLRPAVTELEFSAFKQDVDKEKLRLAGMNKRATLDKTVENVV